MPARALFLLALLLFGYAPGGLAQADTGEALTTLSAGARRKVAAACFEVVVPRPERDSLSYEKELPWDRVPFHLRKDKYISIGTAFAISRTELVTAFHVLDLTQEFLSYPTYYIRGTDQRVYEIDQIQCAHEMKDVVRFTAKGRTFDQWLELQPEYQLDRPVFSVGNALGEGVVIRRGDLVGTLPEPVDGAWQLLKSSAEVNSGNSGGPLMNSQGQVVGVVLQRKDNLCYSLPVSELQALKPTALVYNNKVIYGFNLFPETSKPMKSEFELAGPIGYQVAKHTAQKRRFATYTEDMAALFREQKELFPRGSSSLDVIYDVPTSTFLEVVFKDVNTKRWAITDVKVNSMKVGSNGRLGVANAAGLTLLEIQRPDEVPLAALVTQPQTAIDLVLKGLNVARELAGEKTRITGFGAPIRQLDHRDRFGRSWHTSVWHTEYNDQVILLCSTPTPRGLVGVIQEVASPKLETWVYDLRLITDYLYVPYVGQLREWGPFLALSPQLLPQAFQGMRYTFQEGRSLTLETPWRSLNLDSRSKALAGRDTLGLYMGFNRAEETQAWELRRLVYSEETGDNYFVVIDRPHPVPEAEDTHHRAWKEIAQARHPYTREPFSKEGRTDVAMVLGAGPGGPPEAAQRLTTLYLGRTGSVPPNGMLDRLDAVAKGLATPARGK